jgi:porin
MVCLLSMTGVAEDRPDLIPNGNPSPSSRNNSVDVEIATESTPSTWQTRDQLFGEMGGFRTMLAKHGMTFEISSLDEGFGTPNDTFSESSGGRYHGLTDVVLTLDTEGAGWWSGGLFFIDLQNARGGDISDLIGDVQGISNIVAPPGTRFAEYFLDQSFADGRFRLKAGKQDANADFVVADGGGEFINSSFGIIPTVPLPTYPAPALGIMGGWSPSKAIHVKAGYWDGSPNLGSGISTEILTGSSGGVGAVGIEIRPFGGSIIDGTYRIGYWRHSSVELSLPATKEDGTVVTGPADGIYFTADQGLWESGPRRLAFFAQGGWGEADRSVVGSYYGAGLTFSAPFSSRPDDIVGLGVAHAEIGELERRDGFADSETVIEFFYRLPVLGWMTLNPDIQWVHRPGGTDGNTFVAGLRVATVF